MQISEQKERLRNIIESEPQWAAKCELACRRVKEKYFAQVPEDIDEPVWESLRLATRPPMHFDVDISEVWPAHEDDASWQDRIRVVSEQIDPRTEQGDSRFWGRVFVILQRYVPVRERDTDLAPATLPQTKKQECLRIGSALLEVERFTEGIERLEQGVNLVRSEEPEDIDFELLAQVRKAYRKTHNHEKEAELDRMHRELEDVVQSRNFLRLAEAYRSKVWDERWALRLATEVKNRDSRYYREAESLLQPSLTESA